MDGRTSDDLWSPHSPTGGAGDAGSLVLANGVYVEASGGAQVDRRSAGLQDDLVGGRETDVATLSVDFARSIQDFCSSVFGAVRELDLSELSVEFGLGAKVGVRLPYITKSAVEGSVKVVAKWKRRD